MASDAFSNTASPASADAGRIPFTLYAASGRVLASNVRGKLVDLGHLGRDGDGTWSYRLDGDQSAGAALPTPEAALEHLAKTTTFLFLDGQFTALEDLGGAGRPDLENAVQLHVMLER